MHPYAGYLHLVPRLLVDLGRALPVEDYGRVLSGGSCAVVGGLAAVVYVLARDAVPSGPVRAVLAAAPALPPLAPVEISGNAANLAPAATAQGRERFINSQGAVAGELQCQREPGQGEQLQEHDGSQFGERDEHRYDGVLRP